MFRVRWTTDAGAASLPGDLIVVTFDLPRLFLIGRVLACDVVLGQVIVAERRVPLPPSRAAAENSFSGFDLAALSLLLISGKKGPFPNWRRLLFASRSMLVRLLSSLSFSRTPIFPRARLSFPCRPLLKVPVVVDICYSRRPEYLPQR